MPKMNIIKSLLSLLIIIIVISYTFPLSSVFADNSVCQPIYGGGQNCNFTNTSNSILIDKKILNPSTGNFVDNLTANDVHFISNQTATFQITISNKGNSSFSHVDIKDQLPQLLDPLDTTNYDSTTRTVSFGIDNFAPNETRIFTLNTKVDTSSLTEARQVTCIVNQAQAITNDGQESKDSAQLCIEKQSPNPTIPNNESSNMTTNNLNLRTFPPPSITSTPSTGPEVLPIIALLPAAFTGLKLRKKALK